MSQKPDARKRFPCSCYCLQANGSWVEHAVFDKPIGLTKQLAASLAMANEIVKSVLKKHPVDENRLYLTGDSNGACGVWELLEREPRVWAARGALAGAGRPARSRGSRVPVWAFHCQGQDDPAGSHERNDQRPASASGQPIDYHRP